MSRTKRGRRPVGYEYWSRRPLSRRCGVSPGRPIKRLCHKIERAEGKAEIRVEAGEAGCPRCSVLTTGGRRDGPTIPVPCRCTRKGLP